MNTYYVTLANGQRFSVTATDDGAGWQRASRVAAKRGAEIVKFFLAR